MIVAMGMRDMVVVSAWAGGASLLVAGLGLVLLRRLRRRRLLTQLLALGTVTVVTTVTGIAVAAERMFLSSHDLSVLTVVIVVSSAVSVIAAVVLGRAFERSVAEVTGFASTLVDRGASGAAQPNPSLPYVTGELQSLASELASVSSQLDASRRRELALETARRELVAWVSHDLRSPIASVRAMAEALEEGVVDDAASVHRYHHAIRLESERLGSLVDDLFELSRISAGAIDTGQTFVPLVELVSEVLESVEPAAAAKGIAVVSPIDELPIALVPAADLRRVLHNLLDNAVRHTTTGGTILLGATADRSREMVEIEVSDQCGGIPASDLPRVFDVAFRGDAARTRDRSGGGLGLAIAKGLLEAHAGSIHVTNQPDGCRFVVNLPLIER
jgi:signal transduction histidine kinase